MDAKTSHALVSAMLIVRSDLDSTPLIGTITQSDGRFVVENLPSGRYHVTISAVGYVSVTIEHIDVTSETPHVDLGRILLMPAVAEMEGIEIVAQREPVEFRSDRIVYNAEILSAGGSAGDLLEEIPQLEVDFDGRIHLRGSTGAILIINGEPSVLPAHTLSAFLHQLPASSVDRVEIMTNPPPRYGAAGTAGVVNIVLKDNRVPGVTGGITGGLTSRGSRNANASLGLQHGSVNLHGTYGLQGSHSSSETATLRLDRRRDPPAHLEQHNTMTAASLGHLFDTRLSYQLRRDRRITAWIRWWGTMVPPL